MTFDVNPIADFMENREAQDVVSDAGAEDAASSALDRLFLLTVQQGKQPSRLEAILRWSRVRTATNQVVWKSELGVG